MTWCGIVLTEALRLEAQSCAELRMAESERQGFVNLYGAEREIVKDKLGAYGEAIASVPLGIPFVGHVNVGLVADVGDYHVRGVQGDFNRLIVRPADDPDGIYILVQVNDDFTGGDALGWIIGRDAMEGRDAAGGTSPQGAARWWENPLNKGAESKPAWFVHRSFLSPMDALPKRG
jgi:hypothetical protein